MISEKDIPALYQKLKPQIARDFRPVTVAIVAPGSTTSPNSVPWSSINFAGSSLADIASRNHNLLTGRDNDDHLQYVRQAGRSGVALIDVIARVRSPLDTRYRGDIAAYSTGLIINSYDDTAAAYLPLEVDASTIKLYPSANAALGLTVASTGSITAAPGTATAHQFGYGTIWLAMGGLCAQRNGVGWQLRVIAGFKRQHGIKFGGRFHGYNSPKQRQPNIVR